MEQVRCRVCGGSFAGRVPAGGDGSALMPYRHKANGATCSGSNDLAEEEPLFEVNVWNHEGDIIRCVRDVTYDRAEEIREQYADEPLLSVIVEER